MEQLSLVLKKEVHWFSIPIDPPWSFLQTRPTREYVAFKQKQQRKTL